MQTWFGERLRHSLAVLLVGLALFPGAQSQAQDQKAAPAETKEAATTESEAPHGGGQQRFLVFVWQASPFFFILIGALSIYMGKVILSSFLALRLPKLVPPTIVANLETLLGEKKFREAFDLVRADNSLFSRSLTAGAEKLSQGWDKAMDALLHEVEDGKIAMEHSINPVAVFGQLGPMIGLFGTVIGMVLAFMSLAEGGQPKPSELAKEIGIALCATMEGLVLALPAIYFYAVLKNKVQRLIFDTESIAEKFLMRFSAAVKK